MRPPTRKVLHALEIWRRWPEEIEADLDASPAPFSIADWLQGTRDAHGRLKLSSRKLLVFLKHSSDDSEFKTYALRDGDWSIDRVIAKETHKELARLRSGFLASKGVEGDDVMWTPFETPHEMRDRIAEDTFSTDDERDDFYSMFD